MDRKFGSGSDLLYNLWKHPGVLVLKVKVKRWLVDALRPSPPPKKKPTRKFYKHYKQKSHL